MFDVPIFQTKEEAFYYIAVAGISLFEENIE